MILLASYFFYGWWSYQFLGLLCLSTLLDYLYGFGVASPNRRKARFFLWLSIINNIGILAVFKYYDFFVLQFQQALGYSARGKNVFVVGNSHSQCAIKDTLDIVNFSMGGESVFYSAIKTREILKANPHAIVCIEFYPLSLKTAYINLANNRLPKHYRNYMYYMTADEHLFLLKHNPWKTARVFLSPNFFSVFNKNGSYIKANPQSNRKKQPQFERRKPEYKGTWEDKVEMQNFYALPGLIKAHPNNLFVLTRMPESSQLKFETTPKYLDCLNQLKQKANVTLLDYSTLEFPDTDFADPEHMNDAGQEKVTKMFVRDWER